MQREWFQSKSDRMKEQDQLRLDSYNGKKKLSKEQREEIQKAKSTPRTVGQMTLDDRSHRFSRPMIEWNSKCKKWRSFKHVKHKVKRKVSCDLAPVQSHFRNTETRSSNLDLRVRHGLEFRQGAAQVRSIAGHFRWQLICLIDSFQIEICTARQEEQTLNLLVRIDLLLFDIVVFSFIKKRKEKKRKRKARGEGEKERRYLKYCFFSLRRCIDVPECAVFID